MENITEPWQVVFLGVVGLIFCALAWWWLHHDMSSRETQERGAEAFESIAESHEMAANERTNEPANPPNAAAESRTDDRTGSFVLTIDELASVARMVDHKTTAERPTKASTIEAGFGLKKGDSRNYRRASEIYDAIFTLPTSYRTPIVGRPTDAQFQEQPAR